MLNIMIFFPCFSCVRQEKEHFQYDNSDKEDITTKENWTNQTNDMNFLLRLKKGSEGEQLLLDNVTSHA